MQSHFPVCVGLTDQYIDMMASFIMNHRCLTPDLRQVLSGLQSSQVDQVKQVASGINQVLELPCSIALVRAIVRRIYHDSEATPHGFRIR